MRGAWNVLSDPMQRQRYDQQLMDERAADGEPGSDVELVDDDSPAAPALTGWRKLLAPPPAKDAGAKGAAGKAGAAGREPKAPVKGNRPAPTVVLPDGMHLAEPKSRGMALAFDFAVCVIIYTAVLFVLPGLVKSGYSDIVDRAQKITDVKDAQQSVVDAKSTKDKKSANDDLNKAEKAATKAGVTDAQLHQDLTGKKRVDALDKEANKLSDSVGSAVLIAYVTIAVLALLYLVPITALKGYTVGMRNRRLKVVRVDGSRCGWWPAFARFLVPVVLAIAIPNVGALLAVAMVLWGFRDRNGQGVHDKLARTLVVTA